MIKKLLLILLLLSLPRITAAQLVINPAGTSSGGTVNSVAATVPTLLSVSGSPITGSGTLAFTSPYISTDGTSTLLGGASPTLPILSLSQTATVNNKTVVIDLDETSGTAFQKLIIGPNGSSSIFNIFYNNGTGGTYRTLRILNGDNSGGSTGIEFNSTDVDAATSNCTIVNVNTRLWCGNSTKGFYPNGDNTGNVGLTNTAPANIYSYKFIAANDTAPAIAGNATLNTGSADSAGKITATATSASTAVITFGTAFAVAPACTSTNETTAVLSRAITTTTTLTISGAFVSGDVTSYHCIGY